MNRHLSAERIAMWTLGERTAAEEQHVHECAQCRAHLAELDLSLARFRGAVRQWSQQAAPAMPSSSARPHPWAARWALAAAALLLAITGPLYKVSRDARQREAMARADALLLEQIDAGISRPVPRPMEPLLRLASWDLISPNDEPKKEPHASTQQK